MAFDGITVAALVRELRENLLDGRVVKISQPESDELLITVKAASGQKRIYMSASASLPLLYLTGSNKPGPFAAPNFCMLLRKHIGNGRIIEICQPTLERIVRFRIEHFDDLGDLCIKDLNVELMGKHSNIILCAQDGTVIDSIKHVSAHMSSVREVLPGKKYFIPDTMKKSDPLSVTEEEFIRLLTEKPMPLAKSIYTSLTGISPIAAEEICVLSAADPCIPAKELSSDMLSCLYNRFSLFISQVKKNEFSPAIYYDGKAPKEFSAVPLSVLSSYTAKKYDSISLLLETFYSSKNALTRIHQKSSDLRHYVSVLLERNRKKYDLQLLKLLQTKDRDKFKVYGELLQAYGYNVEKGADRIELLNYHTNENIVIPLDPTKSPLDNAKRYFARYKKQKRAYEALSVLIKETGDDVSYLESVAESLEFASSEDDLAEIKEELICSGYMRRRLTKKKEKIKNVPLHYISSDGFHIYVGKNNLQNDELTFRLASGNDWWFHAKECPGSHVIVKTEGKEVPDRTFVEAGRLAAFYSKSKGSDRVEVDYIEKKHVKKPNGSKPGFVVYYTNYSLITDSDISDIKQL